MPLASTRPLLCITLALALALAACLPYTQTPSPPPKTIPLTQEISALLKLGRERLQQKRYAEAGDAFRAVLRLHPNTLQQARARLGLAQAQLGQGDKTTALATLKPLLTTGLPAPLALPAELLAARLLLANGQAPQAATRLRRLLSRPPGPLDAASRAQAQELLAQALAAQGAYAPAVATLVRRARDADATTAARLAPRIAQWASRAPSREITPLLANASWPEVRAALLKALVRACLREGRLDTAQNYLRQLRPLPPAQTWQDELDRLDQQLSQARLVHPRAVGVILPLSGPYAPFGRGVLAAVELGLALFGPNPNPPTLHIEDSRSQPTLAAQAVSRLVQNRRVMAIIGPMAAATSLAAARRAQQLGVPLITLSQVEGVTLAGDYVFQASFTPEDQVRALLNETIDHRGLTRFAILAPKNAYGQGFAKLMARQLPARGGVLVRTIYYSPQQTDFTTQIKNLVHLPPGNYRPGRPDSPKPVIDFQALFIPDGPQRVAMIAPQLAYLDVTGVLLLGTNLWHDPKLIQIGGRYVSNAVFPDAFDPNAPDNLTTRFVGDFRQAMGREPNLLDALGYDAARMVQSLLNRPQPPRTRPAFRDSLAQLDNLPGTCGLISMGPDRRVSRNLKLFTVHQGRFVNLQQTQTNPPTYKPQPNPAPNTTQQPSPPQTNPAGTRPTVLPAPSLPRGSLPPAATIPR